MKLPSFNLIGRLGATAATQVIVAILQLGNFALIARYLGPSATGTIATIVALTALLAAASNPTSAAIPHYIQASQYARGTTIRAILILTVLGGSVGALVMQLLLPLLLPGLQHAVGTPAYYLIGTAVLGSTLHESLRQMALASGRLQTYNLLGIGRPLSLFTFLCILLSLGGLSEGAAVHAFIGSVVATAGAGLLVSWEDVRLPYGDWLTFVAQRWRHGITAYPAGVLNLAISRLDQLIIAIILGRSATGTYAVAVNLAEALGILSVAAAAVTVGRANRLTACQLRQMTKWAIYCGGISTAVGAIILGLGGKALIGAVYGEAFLPAVPSLWILLPGIVALAIGRAAATEHNLTGRYRIGLRVTVIAVAVTVVGNVALIPSVGIEGAAVTSVLAYTLGMAIQLKCLPRVAV